MDATSKEYVDTKGLEAITGISASTWNKRRVTGDTPPFMKVGRSVRYHVQTVRDWMAERAQRSTSEGARTAA
jgi:predicted DNA-binding transcriptional regulator AlpA